MGLVDDKSTLVQKMAWCRLTKRHQCESNESMLTLNRYWFRPMLLYGVTKSQCNRVKCENMTRNVNRWKKPFITISDLYSTVHHAAVLITHRNSINIETAFSWKWPFPAVPHGIKLGLFFGASQMDTRNTMEKCTWRVFYCVKYILPAKESRHRHFRLSYWSHALNWAQLLPYAGCGGWCVSLACLTRYSCFTYISWTLYWYMSTWVFFINRKVHVGFSWSKKFEVPYNYWYA